MALIRVTPQPSRRHPAWITPPRRELPAVNPDEWREILLAVPQPRGLWSSNLTAIGAGLFVAGVLFSVCVVIIQPFLQLFHTSFYPNLAGVSFTSITLAVFGLILAMLSFLAIVFRIIRPLLIIAFKIFTGIFVIGFITWFFWLLINEFFTWMLTAAGVARFLDAWGAFFQHLF